MAAEGTAESAWRDWDVLTRFGRCDRTQLIRPSQRLVVVAPHPDDEVLAVGALLAAHARAGGPVLLVRVTDGEASHDGVAGWSRAVTASRRRAEGEAGLASLVPSTQLTTMRLGLADSAVVESARALLAALQGCIEADDVVVTTWRHDGHPDHEATGRACAMACGRAGCRLIETPVWMWHWARPGDPRVPWSRLRVLPALPLDRRRKSLALACHRSQLTPRGTDRPVVTTAMVARADWPVEHVFA